MTRSGIRETLCCGLRGADIVLCGTRDVGLSRRSSACSGSIDLVACEAPISLTKARGGVVDARVSLPPLRGRVAPEGGREWGAPLPAKARRATYPAPSRCPSPPLLRRVPSPAEGGGRARVVSEAGLLSGLRESKIRSVSPVGRTREGLRALSRHA
jgi:hypothetical protein